VYLTHSFVMVPYAKAPRTWSELRALPTVAGVGLVWLSALALGVVAHRWLERPLLRLKSAARRLGTP
jgi:peptidoglycan/LPS O-acetylase OafA/YrhL